MFDLYDLLAPRVYVVSEKRYEELLDKRRKARAEELKTEKERLEARIAKIEEELTSLE